MRFPRFRFTLRRIMIVVAVLAILVGAERTHHRWQYYRKRAAWHDLQARNFAGTASVLAKSAQELAAGRSAFPVFGEFDEPVELVGNPQEVAKREMEYLKRTAAEYSEYADYHLSMARKWERGASKPWILVSGDPVPPYFAGMKVQWERSTRTPWPFETVPPPGTGPPEP
jgi:hypothetical protein